MTDEKEVKPGNRSRILLALAILLVFASMMLTTYAYNRNPALLRDAGMIELPWITSAGIRCVYFLLAYWFLLLPVFATASLLAWTGFLGRPGKGVIAAVLVVALAIPVFGYVALEKPLVELQRAMHRH